MFITRENYELKHISCFLNLKLFWIRAAELEEHIQSMINQDIIDMEAGKENCVIMWWRHQCQYEPISCFQFNSPTYLPDYKFDNCYPFFIYIYFVNFLIFISVRELKAVIIFKCCFIKTNKNYIVCSSSYEVSTSLWLAFFYYQFFFSISLIVQCFLNVYFCFYTSFFYVSFCKFLFVLTSTLLNLEVLVNYFLNKQNYARWLLDNIIFGKKLFLKFRRFFSINNLFFSVSIIFC